MNNRFSPEIKEIIRASRNEALRLGNDFVGTEHLLLGILQGKEYLANKVLESLDVDISEIKEFTEKAVDSKRSKADDFAPDQETDRKMIEERLDKHAAKVLKVSLLEAKVLKNDEVNPEHLMLSILKHKDNRASKILSQFDIDYDTYKNELYYLIEEKDELDQDIYSQSASDPDMPLEDEPGASRYQRKGGTKSRTPVLDNF